MSSAIAIVPDEQYEIPYARALANTIALTGTVFAVATFISGCRCFNLRKLSRLGLIACAAGRIQKEAFYSSYFGLKSLFLLGDSRPADARCSA